MWNRPEEPGGELNLYELRIVSFLNGGEREEYVYLPGFYNQCQFYGKPCEYTFYVRAVNTKYFDNSTIQFKDDKIPDCVPEQKLQLDSSVEKFPGRWSNQPSYQCFSEKMVEIIIKLVCFFMLTVLMVALSIKLYRGWKKMKSVKIIFPFGFDPLAQDIQIIQPNKKEYEFDNSYEKIDYQEVDKLLNTEDKKCVLLPLDNNQEANKCDYMFMQQISSSDSGISCPKEENVPESSDFILENGYLKMNKHMNSMTVKQVCN